MFGMFKYKVYVICHLSFSNELLSCVVKWTDFIYRYALVINPWASAFMKGQQQVLVDIIMHIMNDPYPVLCHAS